MFQRSDSYWGKICMEAPVSPSSHVDDNADIVAEYLEDDIAEFSSLDQKGMDYLEYSSVKIETADYEEPLDCNYVDEKFEVSNVEDTDPGKMEMSRASNNSPNDTNAANNTNIAERRIKRKKLTKNITQVKRSKNVRNDNLPCWHCNAIFQNRIALNRHTDAEHNMLQCIRCQFTTTTRFVKG